MPPSEKSAPKPSNAASGAISILFSKLEKIVRGRPGKLEADIAQMRQWLTKDRASRPSGYMNQPRAFSAYTAFHMPLHLPELFWILDQNFTRLGLKAPQSILDLGCGPGTTTLSYLLWCKLRKPEAWPKSIQLFDQSSRAINTAHDLIKALALDHATTTGAAPCEIKSQRGNINYPVDRKRLHTPSEAIFLSHVLNEFGSGPRHREKKFQFLCRIARDHLPASGGLIFIVEPPLREPTLDLMWLRDRISKEGALGREDSSSKKMDEDFENSDDLDEDLDQSEESLDEGIDDSFDQELDDSEHPSLDEDTSEREYFGDEEDDDGDSYFSMPRARVLAPCPEGTMRCPMALSNAGWCYAQPPRAGFRALGLCPWDREIENAVRITWTNPGFSYLVIQAYGDQKPQGETLNLRGGQEGIALTDETRTPSMVCRHKRIRKEGRVPHRGAYLKAKAEAPRVDEVFDEEEGDGYF